MKYYKTVGFTVYKNRKPARTPSDPDPPNTDLPNSYLPSQRNIK